VLVEAQGEMLDNIEAQVISSYSHPHMFHARPHAALCCTTSSCSNPMPRTVLEQVPISCRK